MGIAELKPIWCLVGYLTSVRCGLGLRYTQSRASKLARLSYIWLYWEESNMRSEDTKQLQTDHEEKTKLQLLVIVTWLVMQLKKSCLRPGTQVKPSNKPEGKLCDASYMVLEGAKSLLHWSDLTIAAGAGLNIPAGYSNTHYYFIFRRILLPWVNLSQLLASTLRR